MEDVFGPLPPIPDDSDDPDYGDGGYYPIVTEADAGVDGKEEQDRNVTRSKGRKTTRDDDGSTQIPPSSPPYQYRPNRYVGPSSTWRKWTEQDRQVAASLEEIRARDLSAHLFNAFALKRRARDMKENPAEDDDHWDQIAGVRVPTAPFVPPKRWTAWPMRSAEVPRTERQGLGDEDDYWTFQGNPDPRLSADLEESIIAIMMKVSKERFWAREWMPKEKDEEDWKAEHEAADLDNLRPVVRTDDDQSRQELRPLARNILTRFDELLMGLHYARKANAVVNDSSDTDTESVASRSSSRRKRRLTNASLRSRSRGRKRIRTTSPTKSKSGKDPTGEGGEERENEEEDEDSEAESLLSFISRLPSPSRGRSNERSPRRKKWKHRIQGLRDWGDVLGVASMTRLPESAVLSAAQRCSTLFGEDMIFQTLVAGRVKKISQDVGGETVSTWRYVEESDSDEDVPLPDRSGSRRQREREKSSAGRASQRRTSRSQKRELSAEIESTTTKVEESVPVSSSTAAVAASATRLKGKGEHRKRDIVCPLVSCDRHTNGFSRTWNLNLHMRRKHPGHVGDVL
jgi:hypothetical protein